MATTYQLNAIYCCCEYTPLFFNECDKDHNKLCLYKKNKSRITKIGEFADCKKN
jgi:hypothetical protein